MSKSPLAKLMAGLRPGKPVADAALWQPAQKPYPRLANLDVAAEGLEKRAGIYALWHLGVRPQWLRVGAAVDLGAVLTDLVQMPWITAHNDNGGVFAAWAFPPYEQCIGMVRYLAERLKPTAQDRIFGGDRVVDAAVKAVICPLPPGTLDMP